MASFDIRTNFPHFIQIKKKTKKSRNGENYSIAICGAP